MSGFSPSKNVCTSMKLSKIAQSSALEDKAFLLLLLLVSLAFFWVLWPFYGAVFWGAILR